MYKPHDEVRLWDINPEKLILNKCVFLKVNAESMKGELFDHLDYIGGRDFFCNLMYHHLARDSVIRKRAPLILENLKKQGVKDMVCFHDECYGFYASYCPRNNIDLPEGLNPIHLTEYLYNYLKNHNSQIKKLDLRVAYQRNCSNRFIPETDRWIDKIFDLIGVHRVERTYDRENALCCGSPLATIGKKTLMRKIQRENIKDMIKNNAEACVYNCPYCMEVLGSKVEKKGLDNYYISDICRLALGEKIK